jgi:hypothetical protein
VEDFREKLRARLHAQVENERWEILSGQKKLIAEYARIVEKLRDSDKQILRLLGPPPSEEICPRCHYRVGTAVSVIKVAEENRAGDRIMTCPSCDLVIPP